MDAALTQKHLKIYNLTKTNATLMKLTTIIYLHKAFNLAKDWGVTQKVLKDINQTSKNEPENWFLGSISGVFKNKIKIVTCLMHYVALPYWSKCQTNLTIFQWLTSKKLPRSSLKLYFLLV